MDTAEENMIMLEIDDAAVSNTSLDANQMRDTEEQEEESTVTDYMKYANAEKEGRCSLGSVKAKKNVSFKDMVVNVTFNDNWEMQTSQSDLHTEDQQQNTSGNLMRNF